MSAKSQRFCRLGPWKSWTATRHIACRVSTLSNPMAASDRYSGCGSTLDELIAALKDARDHGAPGSLRVKAYDGDSEQLESVTGFITSIADNQLVLYTDDDT